MRSCAALIFSLTLSFSLPLTAQAGTRIDDPEKFVRTVYGQFVKQHDYHEPDDIYSDRLKALFALDSKEAGGEVGRLDFDPWTDAQDYEIKNVHVSSKPVESAPSRRLVIATFKNIGRPEDIRFYFERTKGGWKLDDMRSVGKEKWTLSLILKYGWDDEK
jgi:hypothetical protein